MARRPGSSDVIDCAGCGRPFDRGPRGTSKRCPPCKVDNRNAVKRRYADRHPERVAASKTQYVAANPGKVQTSKKAWKAKNPERVRADRRATKKRHPEANRSYVRARAARLRGLTVVAFTPEQLLARLSMFAGCWMCGGPKESIDHVKPLAVGGAHMLCNFRPACLACNTRKNDTWPYPTSRLDVSVPAAT